MPFPDIERLAAAQRATDMRLVAFVNGIAGEDALDAEVRIERKDHTQVERLGDVLLHLNVRRTIAGRCTRWSLARP